MEVKEALETFELNLDNRSEETQTYYMNKLRVFAEWCQEHNLELEHVTPSVVKKFVDQLKKAINQRTGKPLSSETVHGYAYVVKLFLGFCSKDEMYSEYVTSRTVKLISVPKVEDKVIEIFKPEEITALFKACERNTIDELKYRDRAILSLLLDTGVRASELCQLTVRNVDLNPRDSYIKVMGKGGKEREIGLGEKSRLALHRYLRKRRAKPDETVFLTRYHEPFNRNGLDQILYRLRDWAGLEGVTVRAHKWRHTFATTYLVNGGDVYKLSRLMGHSSVSTTEKYVRSMKNREARKGFSVLDSMTEDKKK